MSDQYWDNVVLLAHCDGSNGSTTFFDVSSKTRDITPVGSAQISTSYFKFGGSSAYVPLQSAISIAAGEDFYFGSGDFTLEFFFLQPTQIYSGDFSCYGTTGWGIYIDGINNELSFYFEDPAFNSYEIIRSFSWAINTWYHVAISRVANYIYLFVNGQLLGSPEDVTGVSLVDSDATVFSTPSAAGVPNYAWYFDEIRFTKGVGRYSSSFSPITEAFYSPTTPVLRDLICWWYVPHVSGNIEFTDSSDFTHIWGIVDTTSFGDVIDSFLQSNQSAFDGFVFADVIANAYPLNTTEAIVLSSPAIQVLRATMPLVTALRFTSPIGMQRTMAFSVATALVLRDAIGTVKHFGDLIASADFVDTVVDVIRAAEEVIESLILESSATDYLTIFTSSSDVFSFVDEASQFSSVFDHVGDSINFVGALGIDSDEYTVWAVHTQYPSATEYDNYDFNSFAQVGNVYLGAKSDGIYELGGSDDAGADIAAVVRTGLFDFGSAQLKQVTRAYLGYTSSNRLVLKTIATDGGQKVERWYELKDKTADEVRESRIKFGKGVKSRYWQFELINVDGGSFEIDQLHLMPLMLSRRVKE